MHASSPRQLHAPTPASTAHHPAASTAPTHRQPPPPQPASLDFPPFRRDSSRTKVDSSTLFTTQISSGPAYPTSCASSLSYSPVNSYLAPSGATTTRGDVQTRRRC